MTLVAGDGHQHKLPDRVPTSEESSANSPDGGQDSKTKGADSKSKGKEKESKTGKGRGRGKGSKPKESKKRKQDGNGEEDGGSDDPLCPLGGSGGKDTDPDPNGGGTEKGKRSSRNGPKAKSSMKAPKPRATPRRRPSKAENKEGCFTVVSFAGLCLL